MNKKIIIVLFLVNIMQSKLFGVDIYLDTTGISPFNRSLVLTHKNWGIKNIEVFKVQGENKFTPVDDRLQLGELYLFRITGDVEHAPLGQMTALRLNVTQKGNVTNLDWVKNEDWAATTQTQWEDKSYTNLESATFKLMPAQPGYIQDQTYIVKLIEHKIKEEKSAPTPVVQPVAPTKDQLLSEAEAKNYIHEKEEEWTGKQVKELLAKLTLKDGKYRQQEIDNLLDKQLTKEEALDYIHDKDEDLSRKQVLAVLDKITLKDGKYSKKAIDAELKI